MVRGRGTLGREDRCSGTRWEKVKGPNLGLGSRLGERQDQIGFETELGEPPTRMLGMWGGACCTVGWQGFCACVSVHVHVCVCMCVLAEKSLCLWLLLLCVLPPCLHVIRVCTRMHTRCV